MDVVLWIGQAVLAAIFVRSGSLKSFQSPERMGASWQTVVKVVPLRYIRIAGVSELLGVLGVTLPWLTGVARVLTPVAAVGFGVIMVLAAGVHTRLREPKAVMINLVILAVAIMVAWGRFADL